MRSINQTAKIVSGAVLAASRPVILKSLMADLPPDRLSANKPAFTYVGIDYFCPFRVRQGRIDYFGPFRVRQGRSVVKRYACLFTCLVMRAIHVEISHSLDTDSTLNASRRFVSIRGRPES